MGAVSVPPVRSAAELAPLCLEAAQAVFRGPVASPSLVMRAWKLLMGTCAVESGFRDPDRRQDGYSLEDPNGAWGVAQVERISIRETLKRLDKEDADFHGRLFTFIWQRPSDGAVDRRWWKWYGDKDIAKGMALGLDGADPDRLCLAFARLHYFWKPSSIPESIQGQAQYWKTHYNTPAGAGTVHKYRAAWARHCAPLFRA